MALFTKEEIDALYAPFELSQHSIREGHKNGAKDKIRWFVYVDRAEVQKRLEQVFPGEWEVSEPTLTYGSTSVSAGVTITIRGISRGFNGAADGTTADDAKAAATDAFRRAASMWGMAAYIYDMDFDIWTDAYPNGKWDEQRARVDEAKKKFEAWYRGKYGKAQPKPQQPAQQPPAPNVIPAPVNSDVWDKAAADELVKLAKTRGLSEADLKNMMGVKNRWSEWTGGKKAAFDMVNNLSEKDVDMFAS